MIDGLLPQKYEVRCDYCGNWFPSINARDTHYLEDHNQFKNSDKNITVETIEKFRSTMSKVRWILEKYPGSRGDDRILILVYLRIFERHLVYNGQTHRIEMRKKEGLTYEEWRSITAFETIRRSRAKLQEQDKKANHDKDNPAISLRDHSCLLPDSNTLLKRKLRENAIHSNIKTMTYSMSDYDDVKKEMQ